MWKVENVDTKKTFYVIRLKTTRHIKSPLSLNLINDHFNPHEKLNSFSWKFKSRKKAEQLLTMALIKISSFKLGGRN